MVVLMKIFYERFAVVQKKRVYFLFFKNLVVFHKNHC